MSVKDARKGADKADRRHPSPRGATGVSQLAGRRNNTLHQIRDSFRLLPVLLQGQSLVSACMVVE